MIISQYSCTPFNLSPFAFVGPKGEPGDVISIDGRPAPRGPPGATGPPGPVGEDGENGPNGSEGLKGTTQFNSRAFICNQNS